MSAKLDEIKARWAKAMPGPWRQDGFNVRPSSEHEYVYDDGSRASVAQVWHHRYLNATETTAAIAAAPEDVAWLLGEVERLRARLEAERVDSQSAFVRESKRAAHAEYDVAWLLGEVERLKAKLLRFCELAETVDALVRLQGPGQDAIDDMADLAREVRDAERASPGAQVEP